MRMTSDPMLDIIPVMDLRGASPYFILWCKSGAGNPLIIGRPIKKAIKRD
jgi:hypothetical protein